MGDTSEGSMSVDGVSRGSGGSGSDPLITAATQTIATSSDDQMGEFSDFGSSFDGSLPSPVRPSPGMPSPVRPSPGMPSPGGVSDISGGSSGILGGSSIFDDSGPDLGSSVDGLSTRTEGSAADMSPGGSSSLFREGDTSDRQLDTAMGIKEDGTTEAVEQGAQGEQGGGGAGPEHTGNGEMKYGKATHLDMEERLHKLYTAAGGGGGGTPQPAVSARGAAAAVVESAAGGAAGAAAITTEDDMDAKKYMEVAFLYFSYFEKNSALRQMYPVETKDGLLEAFGLWDQAKTGISKETKIPDTITQEEAVDFRYLQHLIAKHKGNITMLSLTTGQYFQALSDGWKLSQGSSHTWYFTSPRGKRWQVVWSEEFKQYYFSPEDSTTTAIWENPAFPPGLHSRVSMLKF
jgi:hypothetical protein